MDDVSRQKLCELIATFSLVPQSNGLLTVALCEEHAIRLDLTFCSPVSIAQGRHTWTV
jgi:hypothetical protein